MKLSIELSIDIVVHHEYTSMMGTLASGKTVVLGEVVFHESMIIEQA